MELIPDRLYLILEPSLNEERQLGDVIINLDDLYQHTKVRKHFGPPSLKVIWKHCDEIDMRLERCRRLIFTTNELNDNVRIEQRTISCFLMASYAVLRLEWDARTTNNLLLQNISARLAFFRDYHGDSSYKLNILDCMNGLQIGCRVHKWFTSCNSTKFPQATNTHLDMNWIIPGQFLAFKDPTLKRDKEARGVSKAVIRELKRCGIKAIVRLNGNDHAVNMEYYGNSYNPIDFQKEKFYHYEIPFRDVNVPSTAQTNQFLALCERLGGKIAVHCHAGLGRTATMIGCHLIKNYGFDSRSVCGWLKMCRRGSVMGPQHFYLTKFENDHVNICKTIKQTEETEVIPPSPDNPCVPTKVTITQANTKSTRISRPPRKNNIIHIVPVNIRSKKANPLEKYQMDSYGESSENKRSKIMMTPQVEKTVKSPSERSKSTKRLLHPKVVTPQPNAAEVIPKDTSHPLPRRIRPKSRIKTGRKATPTFTAHERNVTGTSYRTASGKHIHITPTMKTPRGTSQPMNKRITKSHEMIRSTVRSMNPGIVVGSNSWSQWGEKMIGGFASQSSGLLAQSKTRINDLINSIYSRRNENLTS